MRTCISQTINGNGFLLMDILGTMRSYQRDPMFTFHGPLVRLILEVAHMCAYTIHKGEHINDILEVTHETIQLLKHLQPKFKG